MTELSLSRVESEVTSFYLLERCGRALMVSNEIESIVAKLDPFRVSEVKTTPLGKRLSDGFVSGDFGIPFDWDFVTSPFEKKVLSLLVQVGPGRTVTYGELARRVGSPGGARAVGGAMRKNPLALVIPCHRVLPASGRIGAYSCGGPRVKEWLLRLEAASVQRGVASVQ